MGHNLKFRNFPEKVEENTELPSFIASWLATAMQTEPGIAPLLNYAYRMGPLIKCQPKAWPRDMIVRFTSLRTKQAVMALARQNGFIKYKESKILVMQDLSQETLFKRRLLKPITTTLTKAQIKYKWVSYCKLQVVHQDHVLNASDLDSGLILLKALQLELPDVDSQEEEQQRKPSAGRDLEDVVQNE